MLSQSLVLAPLLPLLVSASALPSQAPLLLQAFNGPSIEHARANAPEIFNTIHSSMRQRAFEIEHAEVFARPRRGRGPGAPGGPGGPGNHGPGKGKGLGGKPPGGPGRGLPPHARMDSHPKPKAKHDDNVHDPDDKEEDGHGYLHTYRTSKPLTKLIYIDGMSAGKTSMGTLDSTDYIIRNLSPSSTEPNNDWIRAADLCRIGEEYGIEGILRMEAGFEIILCRFKDGLEFIGASQRDEKSRGLQNGKDDVGHFEYVRALVYRLVGPSESGDLERIRSDILELFKSREYEKRETINWQNVVDMIVTRYSDHLKFMVQNETSEAALLSEIKLLLDTHTDYKKIDIPSSIGKCANHYLKPVTPKTEADHLIHAAILKVSRNNCSTLFEVRELIGSDEKGAKEEEAKQ
ncbi:hypothetical protein EAF00_005919 [Botryotinia globosa]|nr:hypothetical protein EAF00_005919 [Botryotinia globosa]